jgi:sarcosine oxidase subunit beta
VSIDKNPDVGYGSTSYSSGIIRLFYSKLDLVAFAHEGYHIFKNLNDHLKCNKGAKYYEQPAII